MRILLGGSGVDVSCCDRAEAKIGGANSRRTGLIAFGSRDDVDFPLLKAK